jgi:hypothetical protein
MTQDALLVEFEHHFRRAIALSREYHQTQNPIEAPLGVAARGNAMVAQMAVFGAYPDDASDEDMARGVCAALDLVVADCLARTVEPKAWHAALYGIVERAIPLAAQMRAGPDDDVSVTLSPAQPS